MSDEKDDDGFVRVTRKRSKARPGKEVEYQIHDRIVKVGEQPKVQDNSEVTEESCELLLRKLKKCKRFLLNSEFTKQFFTVFEQSLKDIPVVPSHIVCYGLGSLQGFNSRYQLALLDCLKDRLEAQVEVFDPLFTDLDKEILKKLNYSVLDINEEGKRKATSPTLFFLPHAVHMLISNLLSANWDSTHLPNCILITNSFSSITININNGKVFKYIFEADSLSIYEEYKIVDSFECNNVFNHTSIHTFPEKKCILAFSTHFEEDQTLVAHLDAVEKVI